jgi:hypothetical protein
MSAYGRGGLFEFSFFRYSPLTHNTNIMRMFVNKTVHTTILVTFLAYAICPLIRIVSVILNCDIELNNK